MRQRQIELGTLLILLASYVLVFPVGEYAIDDDWAYVRSLAQLYNEGTIRILDWNPMSLVAHLFWGLLFTKTFGFSFTVAKISVVALAYLECIGVIALLRRSNVASSWIWIAVLTIVFNPLHFFHTFLYGTDIPAVAWTVLAMVFYVRALNTDAHQQITALSLGSLFGGLSFLVRQNGVLVHLAFLAYLILFERRRLRSARFVLSAFGPAALIVSIFSYWYRNVHGPTSAYTDSVGKLLNFVSNPSAGLVIVISCFLFIYVGFFAFPLSFAVSLRSHVPRASSPAGMALALVSGAIFAVLLIVVIHTGLTFPYLPNKITPFGYLRPNDVLLGERDVLWTRAVSWTVSIGFALSFLVVAAIGVARFPVVRDAARQHVVRILALLFGLQMAYLLATSGLILDRHLLILCPTVVVLCCALLENDAAPRKAVFTVLLVPWIFYSIAGTHDLHSISRAAFRAGQALMEEGIDVHHIDGGYAFDGWYVYGRQPTRLRHARIGDGWWIWSLYPSIQTDYVVSLSPMLVPKPFLRSRGHEPYPRLDRYRVYRTYSYWNYWPLGMRTIYVLVDRAIQQSPPEK